MASTLSFSLTLPLGALVGQTIEKQRWFRSTEDSSIGEYIWRRIHYYTALTWVGFVMYVIFLMTHSDPMLMAYQHHHQTQTTSTGTGDDIGDVGGNGIWNSVLMGGLSGTLIGCGLFGALLNYWQIRSGDTTMVRNPELAVQLIRDDTAQELV
uniref:Uncharacterized protein n=1 Tax=Grammatophora oceanica TaxID=210454 RepID=A0A7S1YHG7_9STRA|mmetsp:Transcript_46800/g.69593  ORF Transcript_46800/g.69593 Transcript_46800/m.69593 type:complete len:153 (+) Transcript_46800:88-546(+)|eukprot:CAMPEP_0194029278 /NCGR_PEP_ID=MMETSP0009_2-20130614/3047_1 /TAXON_ID=210454 /ORGANISM="Grammatophora oceanica, Strain CCMP 410" /LENGTH=152 /DNA_ID=CAMNT_0038668897 /DNA_START=75 /DNA_END=533 /DNA_ORIENTATION=+